jgi:hypothetical protein
MRQLPCAAALAGLALAASPALAREPYENHDPERGDEAARYGGYDPQAREAWLADCRHRLSARDSGVGGAAIGGVAGAVAGNRIAGRGNRTVGTLAGAAVGAAAGAVIDKAEDQGRNRDECEAYLDDYYARYTQTGGYPGYGGYAEPVYYPGYGYPPQGWQPVMAPQPPHCTETVEYVYEDVPVRPARRVVPRRAKVVRDKRVKLVPVR